MGAADIVALIAAIGTLISALAPVASAIMGVIVIVQQMKHGAILKQLTGSTNGQVNPTSLGNGQ